MSLVWLGKAAREEMNLLRPSIKKHCVFSKDNSSIFGKRARSLERDAEPRNLPPKEAELLSQQSLVQGKTGGRPSFRSKILNAPTMPAAKSPPVTGDVTCIR